jgi:Peptidase family M1 domain
MLAALVLRLPFSLSHIWPLLYLLVAVLCSTAAAEESEELRPVLCASAPQTTHYRLQVSLDPGRHTLLATGSIQFTNTSSQPLSELYFHLYLNAFKNEHSLWSRHAGTAARTTSSAGGAGQIDVTTLKDVRTNQDLWAAHQFVSVPGTQDETNVRVPLPRPLLPGEHAEWHIEWRATLPSLFERTGYIDDYFFVAQWFPKLAKLEADGTFAHFPFDPRAEFYADFGTYEVQITLPAHFVVGATGAQVRSEVLPNGLQRLSFAADDVHDFAWTAWPGFEEQRAEIAGTQLRFLYPKGYGGAMKQSLAAIEFALPYFTEHFGAYGYPQLTIVHPPDVAAGSMGMEYPTLITTGGAWEKAVDWIVQRDRSIELVTIHELAHQWFYGMLASNEAAWPFLDEGLASYAELAAAEAWLGPESGGVLLGLPEAGSSAWRLGCIEPGRSFPIAQSAAAFPRFSDLADVVYGRSVTLFTTWRRVYSRKFDAALRDYALQFRCAHPTPSSLLGVIEQHFGAAEREQMRIALFDRGSVDFRVAELDSSALPHANGIPQYRNRVTIVREGLLTFPVDVEWTETDGRTTMKQWDGAQGSVTYEWVGNAPLAGAWVDRQQRVLLDDDLLNNAKAREKTGGLLSLEQIAFFIGSLMHWLGP